MASDALKWVLTAYRHSHAHRFRQDRDWLRLSILASCLLAYSVLALTDALAPAGIAGDVAGIPAIFGGLTIAVFIAKIARAETYADWILSAAIYVGVGFSLLFNEVRGEALAQISFAMLLIALGAVRIWIGLTVEPATAAMWLCSSGCIALVSGLVTIAGWAFAMQLPLRTILAVDLLSLGVSIARFSDSVRDANDDDPARSSTEVKPPTPRPTSRYPRRTPT